MSKTTIDMGKYITPEESVFSGRKFGNIVRNKTKIKQLAKDFDIIEVLFPDRVFAIMPSFLEEFIAEIVKEYSKEEFRNKFVFICKGFDITEHLEEAYTRISKKSTAIG